MSLIFSQSLSYYAIHFKVILISTTVISAAVALKVTAPAIADFAVTDAPSIYNGVVSWLKPPYLYLIINCIIIIIVASSKFQSKVDYESSPSISPLLERIPVPVPVPVQVFSPQNEILSPIKHFNYVDYLVHEEAVETVRSEDIQLDDDSLNSDVKYYEPVVWADEKVVEELIESPAVDTPAAEVEISDQVSLLKPSWSPLPLNRRDSSEFLESNEKPLVSARFGHRRSVRGSPEGGKSSLRVSKSKKQETIENTWKTITEGRSMPLARHLRKSDTWETRGGRHHIPVPPQDARMTKTETFHDRSTTTTTTTNSSSNSLQSLSPSSGKLKREASLSQDDLNKRVEAFIKKFNEEMRMQRQESLNQYSEMITRGAQY